MKQIATIWIITFISVITPMSIWYAYSTFIIGNCDPKFGCVGGFQFGVLILSFSAFASSFSILGSYFILKKVMNLKITKATILTTILAGIILSLLTRVVLPNISSSISGMVASWLAISFFIGSVAFIVQKNITRHSS